ncbi:MAG: nitronate monooxygenase, partial [Pseudomonadota bacterium]
GANAARDALPRAIPLFLKIAPDLTRAEIETIAATVLAHRLDGIVATNTTVSRPDLNGPHADEAGGLSGPPLAPLARQALATLYSAVGGRIPIIAVGGIDSAEEVYARIRAGASAVQLYTALTYHGLSLAGRIAQGLDALLARDGAATVAEAVGQDAGSASRSKAG